jgi:hypothetical protein
VIFATTGLTMTASASQLLQNLPHTTNLGYRGLSGNAANMWARIQSWR